MLKLVVLYRINRVNRNEGAQRNHHILSKMQVSAASHGFHLQGWKETCFSQRRTQSRAEKARLWRTKVRSSAQVCKNNKKADVKAEVQDLRLRETKERHAPQEALNRIGE